MVNKKKLINDIGDVVTNFISLESLKRKERKKRKAWNIQIWSNERDEEQRFMQWSYPLRRRSVV